MPGDYPDYTTAMQVIGSNIMIPMDIQGAYIMMPVDIQAQVSNILVDIKAQTIDSIKVELIAETIAAICVGITAETIGELTIDITAQHVGIYSQPEWAALQVEDYDGYSQADVAPGEEKPVETYTVPTDPAKTLFICQWGMFNSEKAAGIGGRLCRYLDPGYDPKSAAGGYTGFSVVEHKPIRFTAGQVVHVLATNLHSTDTCVIYGGFNGYLVAA